MATGNGFGTSSRIKQVGRMDLPGGGKIEVDKGFAYVGHMDPPHGTSVIDVRDPKNPKLVAQIDVPPGIHSHKAAVSDGVMIINHERYENNDDAQGGLKVFDVSDPSKPRETAFFKAAAKGVHRFTFDGRYAYFSPVMEGYVGNIAMILDLADPANPQEVGRWWMPGQWVAGGEEPTWPGTMHRCHHPIRRDDRLYVSYWHGGFVILDISDMTKPTLVSHLDTSPPFPSPTHTTLPMPEKLMGREILVVVDEEAQKSAPLPYAFMWVVDISDEAHPVPIATFMPDIDGEPADRYGAHQRGGAGLQQRPLRHLVQRRPARGGRVQPVSAQGGGLLRARARQGAERGPEQRRLPRRERAVVPHRPPRRAGDPRAPGVGGVWRDACLRPSTSPVLSPSTSSRQAACRRARDERS